jgi:hypothetical protein
MLIKDGTIQVTYNEEVFFSSGVGLDNGDPRSAVGITKNNHLVLFVVDGRNSNISVGLSLPNLASVLLGLGCINATNLDGGGSSTFVVKDNVLNTPSDGSERSVASILAVVNSPVFERVYDALPGQSYYKEYGTNWLSNITAGYYGEKTRVHLINTNAMATFYLSLPREGYYDVYTYLTGFTNAAKNTPFIISHSAGKDTIPVDETSINSTWFKIGRYKFTGTSSDSISISDKADGTLGTLICIDALKIVSYDETETGIQKTKNTENPKGYSLSNYPNPFNSSSKILISLPETAHTSLKVYNLLGEELETLVSGNLEKGRYEFNFDASKYSSGVMYYILQSKDKILSGKMLHLK